MSSVLAPRPLPGRRLPVLAGAVALALLLPVFFIVGWNARGWLLGAVLWAASQALGLLFDRIGIGEPNLRGSGVVAFGMMTRGIVLMLVALAVAVSNPHLAIAGALVYALAYTVELGISLTLYFAGETP